MENQESSVQALRVALPAHLLQRLAAFRIGQGANQSYVVRDKLLGKNYDFEPWQFFVLEVLPGCEQREKLASVFEDRFGYAFPAQEVEALFASIADADLFNEAAHGHPLLKRYANKSYIEDDGRPRLKSFRDQLLAGEGSQVVALPQAAESKPEKDKPSAPVPKPVDQVAEDTVLPAGIQDATDFDPRRARRIFLAFNPRPVLRVLAPLLAPLRHIVLALPLLFFAAGYVAVRYGEQMAIGLTELASRFGFFQHAIVSLLTVNLAVTATTALVAHRYRATVQAVGIALLFKFLPRFTTRTTHVLQLSREERMWLHGAPLLVRGTLCSAGLLTWRFAGQTNPLAAQWGLALAAICFVGLVFAANPLLKGSGYHLMAAFSNEPHLRGKSIKTLLAKLKGKSFKESEDVLLAVYALCTILFLFAAIFGVVLIFGKALHQLKLGGSAFFVMGILGFVLVRRTVNYLREMQNAYERAEQFDRWRRRALPADPSASATGQASGGIGSYLWKAAPLCLIGVMVLPYPYAPGGQFTVSPALQQVVATDVSGVVKVVHAEGGEMLKKGALIAELDSSESRAQVDVLTAQMNEQRAVIDDLKSRPRPSDVALAERSVRVSQTRAQFAKTQMERIEKVFVKGAISLEEMDKARGDYEVAVGQVEEKLGALAVAKDGPTPEQIAAAEAKWESLKAERGSYLDRIERSRLTMPFDGRLLTLGLKKKGNAFYERGEAFAAAEIEGPVTAEVEIPESDMEFVEIGDEVRVRPKSQSERLFRGKIQTIDWNVTERPFGNVVMVMAVLEGGEGLRNGMSGYAKVEGPELPVWKAFTLALVRFFQVEVWSWIP